jgi:hypothetical protein
MLLLLLNLKFVSILPVLCDEVNLRCPTRNPNRGIAWFVIGPPVNGTYFSYLAFLAFYP